MSKYEFLGQLKTYLSGQLPETAVENHVAYYKNYIENEIRGGRSEEEVLSELGDPRLLGRTILDTSKGSASGQYQSSYAYTNTASGAETYSGYDNEPKRKKNRNSGCFFDTSTLLGKVKLIILLIVILALIFTIIRFAVRLLIYILPVIVIIAIISFFMRRR